MIVTYKIYAYRLLVAHVFPLTSMNFFSTEHVAIIVVMQFPPRLNKKNSILCTLKHSIQWNLFNVDMLPWNSLNLYVADAQHHSN